MKKIILLLLFTVSFYGQTLQNPTFGIVTEKNNATDSTPAYFTTSQVDGVHKKTPAALVALKSDLPASYAVIVYVNATNPNSATIFDDVNPPTTNDNAFKADVDNLYIGTDASTWVYNGSAYVTKSIPASSNYYIEGTNTDAGNSKTANIQRTGGAVFGNYLYSYGEVVSKKGGSDTANLGSAFRLSNNAGSENNTFQLNASNGLDLWNYASSTWNKRFTFSSSGNFTASTYNGYYPANEDGTILYHSSKWFTPSSTVSSSGTTVTSVGTQFLATMVGAKLIINGEPRIITGYTSTTVVTVASAYSTNYSGVASGGWGVYSKAFQNLNGLDRNVFFGTTGVSTILTDLNIINNPIVNIRYSES